MNNVTLVPGPGPDIPLDVNALRTLKEQHGLFRSQVRMALDKLTGYAFKNKHGPIEHYKVFKQLKELAK